MHEINFNLDELAEGEVKERINEEMKKIADNILDLNTDGEKVRKLIIEVNLTPNAKRDALTTSVQVKSKLVPQQQAETTILIGRDYNTGGIAMNELQSGTPGQTFIDPDDGKLKTDIGEDIEEIEAQENEQIVDFNQRKTK